MLVGFRIKYDILYNFYLSQFKEISVFEITMNDINVKDEENKKNKK